MKLETIIPPRKDGTVNAEFPGITYRFAADEQGRLVAEVVNDAHIAFLLSTDKFLPADESDFELASEIANAATDDKATDDDGDGDENPNAPPVESATPPSLRRARKVK